MALKVKVTSPNVKYEEGSISSKYRYESAATIEYGETTVITPCTVEMDITTVTKIPKVGLMMVGLGGNNGTTFTGMILANKYNISWNTKSGIKHPDFLGSVSQVGTIPIGLNKAGKEVFVPIKHMIPLLNPVDIEIDGWDISSMNLADAMKRAEVFDFNLQEKLRPLMENIIPRKGVFYQDFVAANQADRADNVVSGTKWEQIEQLRADIKDFKTKKNLDKIIVLWVGNTERFVEVSPGLNDTWKNLEKSIKEDHPEVSPSNLYAIAAIMEGCGFINGSPQNTIVPGILELADEKNIFAVGDDLKTGQTKLKSVLMDFLVGAGIRPESIVSYNHLGNNDGMNLSAPHTFRSKEITKVGVVEDMVDSNTELYPDASMRPDHLVVIKYVPSVGDSKRAMDEYRSAIGMGGTNTISIHNTCEDSLLATTVMLDLVIFMEWVQRLSITVEGENISLDIGNVLGYWLKAPLSTLTNSLFRQRAVIEMLARASHSLPPYCQLPFQSKSTSNNTTTTCSLT